jgi:WD40 repeat protein
VVDFSKFDESRGTLQVGASSPDGFGSNLPVDGQTIVAALFSQDNRTLLTIAGRSGSWEEARLWDVATKQALGPPMPHQGRIRAKVFGSDSRTVLTGSDDGTARLWDATTGKPLGPPMVHGGRVRAVALRPDGKLAATGGDDGAAQLWHLATGQPLGPPLTHPAALSSVTFGTEGDTLITVAADNRVRIWKIPEPVSGDAKRLLLETEFATGMSLDGGAMRLLDDAERAQRGQQLHRAEPARPAQDGR